MSSFNITGIYDQTYVIDSNVFSDISILQTGLSSLNTTVFGNYTEFNEYRTTTNNNFSLFNNDLDNLTNLSNSNFSMLDTKIDNLKITTLNKFNLFNDDLDNLTNLSNSNFSMLETKIDNLKITTLNKFELVATGLSVLEEDFTSYQTTTNQLIVDNLQESKDYTDQEVDELRTEGYIQEAVTQVLAWATSDEGKRFRKKIWDRLKLKWLSFTGNRPYTELIDDVEQEMTNELDEMLKVYRYQDDGLTGQIAGIRTDPYSNKEICMKGDTYIFSGNLYLTGDIYKGTFNQTTGLWASIDKLNDFLVIKGFHDKTLEFIHINPTDQKLEIKYDNNSFETTGGLSIKLAVNSNLKISDAGLAVDPDYTKTIKEYKDDAETAKDQAVTAKNQAVTAKNQAETAETQAQLHKTAAQTSATSAETAETQAQLHKTAAQTSATTAETAETQAQLHKTAAQTAQTAAQSSQTAAAASATTAQTSQTAAAASATAAEASATAAGASQTAAAASATAAEASVAAVTASATAAEASATASAGSATTAAGSATAAGASATAAAGSAGAAAGSAGLAAGSAAAAALSALSFRKGDKGDQGDPGPMGPMGPMGSAGSPLSITWASPLKYNVTSNTVLYDYVDAALVYDSVYPVVRFMHPFDTSLQILANRNSTSRVYFTPGGPSFDYDNPSNNNISLSDFMTINGQTRIIGHLKSSSFQSNGEATILNTLNISGNTTINNSLNVVGNITTSGISIFSLNTTTTTIFNNLNSFSTNGQLSINNISSTSSTISTNLNNFSTNAQLSINNISSTSSTISSNLNNFSTNAQLSINNISSTTSTISTNLNNFSTNAQLSINNLNATSTTIFNKTNFNNLVVTGATTFYNTLNISGATTLSSSLNVVGNITTSGISIFNLNSTTSTILSNLNSFSTSAQLSINNLSSSSGVLTNLNNFSTSAQLSINNLNATSTTIFNSLSGKQNTLTFSNPFNLSTNNNLSLKLDATLTTDASGNLKVVSGGASQWTTTGTSIFYNTGNVGIGGNPSYRLDILGSTDFDATCGLRLYNDASQFGRTHLVMVGRLEGGNDGWNLSGGRNCFIFGQQSSRGSAITYVNAIQSYSGQLGFFASGYSSTVPAIQLTSGGTTYLNNGAFITGKANINNGNPIAHVYMGNGSLTIGDIGTNFGWGSGWTGNTAGLMLECADNTEIAVHDSGQRVTSLIAYQGGASYNHIHIGRDMYWGAAWTVNFPGAQIALASEWYIYKGTTPTNVVNSLIFNHITTTINSKWWLNGTQTNTNADISDERIKKEIKDIDNSLEALSLLKPKEYYLCSDKDYIKKYGIIAQDVNKEESLKHLIFTDTEYIADILTNAKFIKEKIGEEEVVLEHPEEKYIKSEDNPTPYPRPKPKEIFKYTLTTEKNLNLLINIDDELKICLDNDNKDNIEIVIDDTPYNNRYKKRFVKVKGIIDDYTFEIYEDITDINDKEKDSLFIYGKKVNDFLKLDYESLYCLNIKATQELYKIIQQQQTTINELINRITILENK